MGRAMAKRLRLRSEVALSEILSLSLRCAKGTKCLRTSTPSSGEEPSIFCPFSRRAVALGLCADECAVTAEWRCAAVTAPFRRLRAEFAAARDIFLWLAVMDSARDGL